MMAQEHTYGTADNGVAVAGLCCGVAALAVLWPLLAPLAIGFGATGWSRANRGARHKGMSVTAVVLGVVAITVWLLIAASPQADLRYFVW